MSAHSALREARRIIHEAECRELETDNLKRRHGRWYVKRGNTWKPLDPEIFQSETEQEP